MLQPVIFNWYIKKNYNIDKNVEPDKEALAQRWDGLGINIASFIRNNTDVVILTLFTDLKTFIIAELVMSIALFEFAFRKDRGDVAINGIEMIGIGSITILILNLFNTGSQKINLAIAGAIILINVYYIVKSIVIALKKSK